MSAFESEPTRFVSGSRHFPLLTFCINKRWNYYLIFALCHQFCSCRDLVFFLTKQIIILLYIRIFVFRRFYIYFSVSK